MKYENNIKMMILQFFLTKKKVDDTPTKKTGQLFSIFCSAPSPRFSSLGLSGP
jgi:hypothetical protein